MDEREQTVQQLTAIGNKLSQLKAEQENLLMESRGSDKVQ